MRHSGITVLVAAITGAVLTTFMVVVVIAMMQEPMDIPLPVTKIEYVYDTRILTQNNRALLKAQDMLETTRVSSHGKETVVEQLAQYQRDLQELINILEEL
jgi:hypothetical protein